MHVAAAARTAGRTRRAATTPSTTTLPSATNGVSTIAVSIHVPAPTPEARTASQATAGTTSAHAAAMRIASRLGRRPGPVSTRGSSRVGGR